MKITRVGQRVRFGDETCFIEFGSSYGADAMRLSADPEKKLATDFPQPVALARPRRGRFSGREALLQRGKELFETGMKCAEIAQIIGYTRATVEGSVRKWGWERKTLSCYKCGALVKPGKSKTQARDRVCNVCELERCRTKTAKRRAAMGRDAIRSERRAYVELLHAKGVRVSMASIRQAKDGREVQRLRKPAVQLGRFRYYGEPPFTRDGALEVLRATLVKLLDVRCAEEGVSRESIEYKVWYKTDEVFRERERLRSSGKRWGNRADGRDDGTLTKEVVRKLFAKAKTCPYCWQPMKSQDKSLDHMEPLSLGGWHGIDNVMVCCLRCNVKKHATPYAEWLERIPEPCQRKLTERAA